MLYYIGSQDIFVEEKIKLNIMIIYDDILYNTTL